MERQEGCTPTTMDRPGKGEVLHKQESVGKFIYLRKGARRLAAIGGKKIFEEVRRGKSKPTKRW